MQTLRTSDERFENLPDFSFRPHYTEVDDCDGGSLRIHHLQEGAKDAPTVVCMHGQPSWSYLYRHMIPSLLDSGLHVLAPDLVGYGRSDKPASVDDYSYQRQVDWLTSWLLANDVRGATFFGQDWGGLIGLRIVAENPERFDAVVIGNTGLPVPQNVSEEMCEEVRRFRTEAPTPSLAEVMAALSQGDPSRQAFNFAHWQKWCYETADLPVATAIMGGTGGKTLSAKELAAYDAPFPDASYKMGPRAMPSQVPTLPDDPSVAANKKAWQVFEKWEKPFVCTFSDNDPVTKGGDKPFLARVPGAKNQPHTTLKDGGHFLQETHGKALADIIARVIHSNT